MKVLARDKGEPPVGASQNAKANTQSDVAPINGTEVSLQKGSEQVLAHIEHPAGLSVLHTDFAPIDADHAVIVELGVDDDGLAHFCIDVEVLP